MYVGYEMGVPIIKMPLDERGLKTSSQKSQREKIRQNQMNTALALRKKFEKMLAQVKLKMKDHLGKN